MEYAGLLEVTLLWITVVADQPVAYLERRFEFDVEKPRKVSQFEQPLREAAGRRDNVQIVAQYAIHPREYRKRARVEVRASIEVDDYRACNPRSSRDRFFEILRVGHIDFAQHAHRFSFSGRFHNERTAIPIRSAERCFIIDALDEVEMGRQFFDGHDVHLTFL